MLTLLHFLENIDTYIFRCHNYVFTFRCLCIAVFTASENKVHVLKFSIKLLVVI